MESQLEQQREAKLLELIRALANELGARHVRKFGLDSMLNDELGIDSLGRLELMLRVQQVFRVSLVEGQVLDVETPRELMKLVEAAPARTPCTASRTMERFSVGEVGGALDVSPPIGAVTLPEVLRWHAERTPSRTHLTLLEGDSARHITYGELLNRAEAACQALRRRGVLPGEHIAIMLPTCEDYFATFFGILLVGAVPVPLDPPSNQDKLDERLGRQVAIMNNAEVSTLISARAAEEIEAVFESKVSSLTRVITSGELLADTGGSVVAPERKFFSAEDVSLLQYTSGSTADPKGVALTHAALLSNVRAIGEVLRINSDDVVVSWLPLYHDMGLIGAWFGSLYHGCRLVIMPPKAFLAQPQRWLWAIHDHRGTLSIAPNFAYELCASRLDGPAIAGLDLSSWRAAMNGAEPVSPGTMKRFCDRFAPHGLRPETLSPVYGLAENCVALTLPRRVGPLRVDTIDRAELQRGQAALPVADNQPGALQVVGCGHTIPEHDLRIVDADGFPNAERREGRVQFRGPSATRGYHRNPDANERLFDGDWLETGDLGYVADGELFLTGRSKDVIIRAGRNIHPHEIEQAIANIERVHKGGAAVLGIADQARGTERLAVVAETRAQDQESRDEIAARIQSAVRPILGGFPDDILLVRPGAIPKTSSGKLRRAECRDRYLAGRIQGTRRVTSWLARSLATSASFLIGGFRLMTESAYAIYGLLLIVLCKCVCGSSVLLIPGLRRRRRFVSAVCRLFLRFAGIRLTVEGRDHLATRPCLVVANHQGLLSGIVMHAVLPDWFFFTPKREFIENPLADAFLRRLGVQYVDKRDPKTGVADLEAVKNRIGANESAMVFPEGVFYREPGLHQFYMGGFVIASATATPVVPIAIRGARAIWRGKTWLPFLRRGSVTVTVTPPIAPHSDDWQAAVTLHNESRDRILPHTGEFDAYV